jgi:translation initiation factor 3 subunit I
LTGASDSTSILWDAQTGRELFQFHHEVSVKYVDFSIGDELSLHVTDRIMGKPPTIKLYRMTSDVHDQLDVPLREIVCSDFPEKIHQARFGMFNETIVSVDGMGRIQRWDTETGKLLQQQEVHDDAIVGFDFDAKRLQMITASLDCSAQLFDVRTLKVVKTYVTNIPVRAVSISPLNDHVILAGGQDAKDVATKRMGSDNSQFSVRFYHKVFGDLIGTVKGGFSTVTSLTFSPDGKGFCVGSEEGTSRMYRFGEDYLTRYSREADAAAIQLPE